MGSGVSGWVVLYVFLVAGFGFYRLYMFLVLGFRG